MVTLNKFLWVFLMTLLFSGTSYGQPADGSSAKEVVFRFVPGNDMFYIPWKENGPALDRLQAFIEEYRDEIVSGTLPIYVDGYCASKTTSQENLKTAFVRSNRVKSELIVRKGLKEENFITKNHTGSHEGNTDLVIVRLFLPSKPVTPPAVEPEEAPGREDRPILTERKPVPETQNRPEPPAEPEPVTEQNLSGPAVTAKPYCFSVRTNILYDAFLLPTLGVEWRVNRSLGIKLDGSRSWWGGEKEKVQKIWVLNPELRWYLLSARRFYVGASGGYGQYNLYKYPLGRLFSADTGYQGDIWSAGITVGYQLYLSRSFSLDFNLGLGYIRSSYDSFRMIEGTRVYKERGKFKNFWGPTQAGINLVWTIGSHRKGTPYNE